MDTEFWPLPWQEQQWAWLLELSASARLPHALLLAGPSGTGKAGFAAHFAKLLLCSDRGSQPCGSCRHCRLVAAASHPDLVRVQPAEPGKGIRIDQVRALREFCAARPHQSGWRVILIEPAEALNASAANALLKTLEEPGAETLLLLVTHEPGRLPATVRSRCRLLRFAAPDGRTGLAWLRHRLSDAADAGALLQAAGGRPLRALALAAPETAAQLAQLERLATAVADGTLVPPAAAAESAKLDWALASDALLARLAGRIRQSVAQRRPAPVLFDCLDALVEARRELAASPNLNAELVWDRLWLAWRRAGVAGGS
jgi:DNA polymerase-3 subunit delta'